MALDVMALLDQESARAAQPKASGKPTFLYFKPGHKALVRPLLNLDRVAVMKMHHKYSPDADARVNATCASEVGKPCKYCEMAIADKKLSAGLSFMLPVFVYRVVDAFGNPVTMKDENGVEKPVSGVRVIELTVYGTISAILQTLRSYFKDDDSHDITQCDWTISQIGEGQGKQFSTLPKSPSQFTVRMQPITEERVRTRIVEALPPMEATNASKPVDNAVASFVQGVVNGQAEASDAPIF